MATNMKRQTITLTEEMAIRLDRIKQAKYYNTSQSKMLQDLICLGIDAMEKRIKAENRAK